MLSTEEKCGSGREGRDINWNTLAQPSASTSSVRRYVLLGYNSRSLDQILNFKLNQIKQILMELFQKALLIIVSKIKYLCFPIENLFLISKSTFNKSILSHFKKLLQQRNVCVLLVSSLHWPCLLPLLCEFMPWIGFFIWTHSTLTHKSRPESKIQPNGLEGTGTGESPDGWCGTVIPFCSSRFTLRSIASSFRHTRIWTHTHTLFPAP